LQKKAIFPGFIRGQNFTKKLILQILLRFHSKKIDIPEGIKPVVPNKAVDKINDVI
jgi:hypothetical protein